MDAVNALTTSLEMDQTVLARYMMDTKAIGKGGEGRQNYTSPRDMNRLLLALYHGRILDAPERALILGYAQKTVMTTPCFGPGCRRSTPLPTRRVS